MNTKKILCIAVFIAVISCGKARAYEYIGYAEALQRVQIRPEISARIIKTHFREGALSSR